MINDRKKPSGKLSQKERNSKFITSELMVLAVCPGAEGAGLPVHDCTGLLWGISLSHQAPPILCLSIPLTRDEKRWVFCVALNPVIS